jgi:hypothetical protein
MSRICATGSILIDGPDAFIKEGVVQAAMCRRWACPGCSRVKASELRMRLRASLATAYQHEVDWLTQHGQNPANAWHIVKFLTLTVGIRHFMAADRYDQRDWTARPEEARHALRRMMRAWNRLHSWLRSRWTKLQQGQSGPLALWEGAGRSFPFFWVVEFTQNGWPHLHVILLWRDRIPWPDVMTMRRLWAKYGIGKQVKLKNKNWRWSGPQALANYVAKYLSKPSPIGPNDGGFRRWSSSRGFLPRRSRREQVGEAGWSEASVETHRAERLRAGAQIQDTYMGFRYRIGGRWLPERALALEEGHWGPSAYQYPGANFKQRLTMVDPGPDPRPR